MMRLYHHERPINSADGSFRNIAPISYDLIFALPVSRNMPIVDLPSAIYEAYDNIKMKKEYNNIAFAILAIPVLASCLEEVYTECSSDTMEELLEAHPWFRAVCVSYKNRTGKELLYEDFVSANKLELAQMVLNSASCNGLKDFGDMLLGSVEESGDDDE